MLYTYFDSKSLSFAHVKFPSGYILRATFFFQGGFVQEKIHICEGLVGIENGEYLKSQNTSTFNYLEEVYVKDLEYISSNGIFIRSQKDFVQGTRFLVLKRMRFPKLKRASSIFTVFICPQLIDVELGAMETSFSLNNWLPTEVLADTELTATLNKNIRDHIAANITDRNGLVPLTITFHQDLRNALEEATEQAFYAKGWDIAPAKSV